MSHELEYTSPTPEDLERIRPVPNMLKVSGDGAFATLQGEGLLVENGGTAGLSAVFLRLHYCNLACGLGGGWKCDTGYTWDKRRREFWQEPEDWSCEQTVKKIENEWQRVFGNTKEHERLVITGGEPLLQQKKILDLLQFLPQWEVEIETNGTVKPIKGLNYCQFNCSPKLENSGNPLIKRYRPDVLRCINSLSNSWFKFVVVTLPDLDEIEQIAEECRLDNKKILIMPEGHTSETVSSHAESLESEIVKRGWKMALRHQLRWFGAKRRA